LPRTNIVVDDAAASVNIASLVENSSSLSLVNTSFLRRTADYLREEAMLPTPSTSHVAFERVYEPAEDSYLFLDTLSSELEKDFLQNRFSLPLNNAGTSRGRGSAPPPVIAEIGTGSGVILAFVNAHAEIIFGRSDVLTIGLDVNGHACQATQETVRIAALDRIQEQKSHGFYVGNILGDLTAPLRAGVVDVLIFNPPYVPTHKLPKLPQPETVLGLAPVTSFENDSYLLALSYAGGADGMETTNKLLVLLPDILSPRGVAYILLCAQNKPESTMERIRSWSPDWAVEVAGSSGKKAGWEKLQIIRIWQKNRSSINELL
jgi:release factor glutamine methyltransferase